MIYIFLMEKQIFNTSKALELLDNDKDLLGVLVDSFLGEEFSLEEVKRLVGSKKFLEAASYVHKTKGAARQLCMEKLCESGQNLEDCLRGKTEGNIPLLSQKMFSDWREAVESAKTLGA